MNRKDFDLLTRAIKKIPLRAAEGSMFNPRSWAACAIADELQGAEGCNGFDRAMFMKRCGL